MWANLWWWWFSVGSCKYCWPQWEDPNRELSRSWTHISQCSHKVWILADRPKSSEHAHYAPFYCYCKLKYHSGKQCRIYLKIMKSFINKELEW